jgi:hypothetical protein
MTMATINGANVQSNNIQTSKSSLWPAEVSPTVVDFFADFYRLFDGRTEQDATDFSNHFSSDGKISAFGHTWEGQAGEL